MRAQARKDHARAVILKAACNAVEDMPGATALDLEIRQQAIEDIRRIERLFGYEPAFRPYQTKG